MLRKISLLAAAFLSSFALAACSGIDDACDAFLRTAIRLQVRDLATGMSIAANTRVIAARREGGTDTLPLPGMPPTDSSVFEVGDLGGTYDLLVQKPGYAEWKQTVSVPSGGCHPAQTIDVTAKLQVLGM